MALCMRLQTAAFGSFQTLDLAALRMARIRLQIGYSHPARLSWVMYHPQQSLPLPLRAFVQFWDSDGVDPAGVPYSASNPLFEGFITEVTPGAESQLVEYVAYDPTRKVSDEVTIMSAAWPAGTVPSVPPTEATGAYPRLVFNAKIDNDDDYGFARTNDATLGDLIATLLADQYHPLYWCNAAPGDGSSEGNGLAWLPGELVPLTLRPQEKLVFDSEPVRSGVERLLQWMPHYRMLWQPGSRLWRFLDITQSPATAIVLNGRQTPNPVLSMQLTRSLEGRYTAVRIYGPQTLQMATAQLSDGTLTDISSGPVLQSAGGNPVFGKNRWQVTNPLLRRISRLLPEPVVTQYSDYQFVTSRSPVLEGYWPATSGGPAGWRAIAGWQLDAANGIVSFAANYVYRYNRTPATGQPNYENPTNVRLRFAVGQSPLQVRVPETGFSGTAATECGLQSELKIYDEMLAVGFEYGQPVTTANRVAQFLTLAGHLHRVRRDVIYAGGVALDGLAYDFARLNKRVNLTGVNANGQTITTGWESINAFLTDVEYDFDENMTTLQFSSDQLELIGVDPERMKQILRVRALQRRVLINFGFNTRFRSRSLGEDASGLSQTNSVFETSLYGEITSVYIDPETGLPG